MAPQERTFAIVRWSSSIQEVAEFNNKVKLVTRTAYGFKTQEDYEIALYHNLGDLPELELTHKFF